MGMLKTRVRPEVQAATDEQRLREARAKISARDAEVRQLTMERDALEAQLAGKGREWQSWWQMKGARQRKALDRLQRKVETQRFMLRLLVELGRDITREEYLAARDRIQDERLRERIEVPE
jgi:hypothetical protein